MFQVIAQIHGGDELQQRQPPVAQKDEDPVEDERARARGVREWGEPLAICRELLERRIHTGRIRPAHDVRR
jgi:hypothetical protein